MSHFPLTCLPIRKENKKKNNNLKIKKMKMKRNINIDLAILPSYDTICLGILIVPVVPGPNWLLHFYAILLNNWRFAVQHHSVACSIDNIVCCSLPFYKVTSIKGSEEAQGLSSHL